MRLGRLARTLGVLVVALVAAILATVGLWYLVSGLGVALMGPGRLNCFRSLFPRRPELGGLWPVGTNRGGRGRGDDDVA